MIQSVERPGPQEFVQRVRRIDSEQRRKELFDLLRSDRDYADATLGVLAQNRSPEVRLWAVDAAEEVLGAGAEAVLLRLAHDRDADTRIEAVKALARVAPQAAPVDDR